MQLQPQFEESLFYLAESMLDKETIRNLLCKIEKGKLPPKSWNYGRLAAELLKHKESLSLELIRTFVLNDFTPIPIDFHLNNLKSGKLNGHSWHGAAPSRLHLKLQDHVREFIRTKGNLDELIKIGTEVMMHEYFMVAIADLTESVFHQFDFVIPANRSRSISDIMFHGLPFDVKNTGYPEGLNSNCNNSELVGKLFGDADSERILAQAKDSHNAWGLNRIYVVSQNPNRWLNEPEVVMREIAQAISNGLLFEPLIINSESTITCSVIRLA